jgi:hypothetical protein
MSDFVRHYDFPVTNAGEYAGGRKTGLERVKDQENRREKENHNVGRGST